jgi:hypothetical protein
MSNFRRKVVLLKTQPVRREETAPVKQLLLTEQNVHEVVGKIYVKKGSMTNPDIINTLRHLCAINRQNDPMVQLGIFLARKDMLEKATQIYLETDQEELFNETADELEVIIEVLKQCTITR